jgi:uncharacterized protein (TIGR03083 family)
MLSLEAARHAAIRDLDATLARMRDLHQSDWERPTPCAGWAVIDLAAHIAESTYSLSGQAARLVELRTGSIVPVREAQEANPHIATERLLARLTHGRNQLYHVLEQLDGEDMNVRLAPAEDDDGPALTGGRLLATCVAEFGIHRYDLDAALGEHEAGIGQEAVLAGMEIYARWLDALSRRHDHVPDRPYSLHLEGELIDATLSWDGKRWLRGPAPTLPVTHVRGDDSTITLFLFGRVRADDHRLDVDGDLVIASSFKTWVPGP